ncbi:unnamed protein product [Phyllotreta striolata]|uniref:Lipase domain-containing protein n=1 Tax=Phyllotreta striolata TaxID=444603 RepID=A0A9N9TVG0_PHYSR|nr:unnamed protein product [Phyllotreta striolata]
MKRLISITIILLTTLQSQSISGTNEPGSQEHIKFFFYQDEQGHIKIEDLTSSPAQLSLSLNDVAYYFYSKKNPERGIEIHGGYAKSVHRTYFNASKETVFIIHGWKANRKSVVNSIIKDQILNFHDVNVFVVDWSPVSARNYISAKRSVEKLGEFVANFAKKLRSNSGLKFTRLTLVGHSLGAHIAGCAGKALAGQISKIIGLDPAGPLFSLDNRLNRIDKSDARFVQIIHTNAGKLGFDGQLGHADYYPNGGSSQPGCGFDFTGTCSHSRAYNYYAESLITDKFSSVQCDNYSDFRSEKCDRVTSYMGTLRVDTRAYGKYFLTTNSEIPWARG